MSQASPDPWQQLIQSERDLLLRGLGLLMQPSSGPHAMAAARLLLRLTQATTMPESSSHELGVFPAQASEFEQLQWLIERQFKLQLHYQDAKAKLTAPVVWPIVLADCAGHYDVLIGWCEAKQGLRMFRLDHVLELIPLEQPVPQPRHALIHAYYQSPLAGQSTPYLTPLCL